MILYCIFPCNFWRFFLLKFKIFTQILIILRKSSYNNTNSKPSEKQHQLINGPLKSCQFCEILTLNHQHDSYKELKLPTDLKDNIQEHQWENFESGGFFPLDGIERFGELLANQVLVRHEQQVDQVEGEQHASDYELKQEGVEWHFCLLTHVGLGVQRLEILVFYEGYGGGE